MVKVQKIAPYNFEFREISVLSSQIDCSFIYNVYGKDLLRKLANRIKELRKTHKITQEELSYRAGIGRSMLGNIETVQNVVTFTKINKIAKTFNLSLSDFLNF